MKKRVLNVVIGFICISLAGIVIVQYLWIRNAFEVKEAQFDHSVNEALTAVVNKLETHEDIAYLKNNLVIDSVHSLVQSFSRDPILSLNYQLDSLLKADDSRKFPLSSRVPHTRRQGNNSDLRNNNFDTLIGFSGNRFITRQYINGFTIEWNSDFDAAGIDSAIEANQERIAEMQLQFTLPRTGFPPHHPNQQMKVHNVVPTPFPADNHEEYYNIHERTRIVRDDDPIHNDLKIITRKARKIKDVIQRMAKEMETRPLPVEKRISRQNLASSLSKELAEKDIKSHFEYAVISTGPGTSKVPIKSPGFQIIKRFRVHRISLFPNDLFRKSDSLLVYFPEQGSIILRSLSGLMLASLFFTLIIILSSIMGIATIIRQKKISDIKTDFINNMTHEFKTPIATISIAVDSINNPRVIDEPDRIKSFTKIIREENNRMNTRVEQVLQMALLDSSEFRLNLKPVDVNNLVQKVSSNLRLQVENREGSLLVETLADNPVVQADEIHLANVIMNLLDNANKYSPAQPEIKVITANQETYVTITVEDKGLGMNPETQRKVFEKFFRLTSGNIHNVKGFGLGLSYARAIVVAHHGEIMVRSEQGKGSTFVVRLPLTG